MYLDLDITLMFVVVLQTIAIIVGLTHLKKLDTLTDILCQALATMLDKDEEVSIDDDVYPDELCAEDDFDDDFDDAEDDYISDSFDKDLEVEDDYKQDKLETYEDDEFSDDVQSVKKEYDSDIVDSMPLPKEDLSNLKDILDFINNVDNENTLRQVHSYYMNHNENGKYTNIIKRIENKLDLDF